MSATTTEATWKSQPSPSSSHHRSPHSRPSTTPHGLTPRTPASTGQPMPPLPPQDTMHSPRTKMIPSPSYFGFAAHDRSEPSDSNPGQHSRHNWDYPCSGARETPMVLPADANPDFEAFRRQSEHGPFNLAAGNPAALGKTETAWEQSHKKLNRQCVQENSVSPRSDAQLSDVSQSASPFNKDAQSSKTGLGGFFDIPRRESPAAISPGQAAAADHRNARLSLPANHLHTPPPRDQDRKPAQRAETLPESLHKDGPNMVSSQQFVTLLQSLRTDVLLLDLRVAPQYSVSRIRGALNLCIPTTLMKRPSFNTQKLRDTFATQSDREKFSQWMDCSFIAVYDATSTNMKDAQTPINVLKKFSAEGWKGQGIILKGGFAELSRTRPSLIERGPTNAAAGAVVSPLLIVPPAQAVAPVAGGCPMPTSKAAMDPFFNNIRQNMDLLDGVGQLPVSYPAQMSAECENALPEWLRKAVAKENNGKLVAEEFLAIERTEQKRMQDALSCTVTYGSPKPGGRGKVQVAGIEKGAKNRYNNIFPYDHSRVHLQNVAAGGCDYINANHIKASYSNKRYIATQAPIPATFNDFWRLVWEQDARILVMLTAESEGGQLKSHPYWPTGDYGPLKLKLFSEKHVSLEPDKAKQSTPRPGRPSIGPRRSTNPLTEAEKTVAQEPKQRLPEKPCVIVRHLTLSHSNLPFEPMREIVQLQYTQWPDFGAPAHPQHLLALIEQTSKFVQGVASPVNPPLDAAEPVPGGQRPTLVHCSAGCGRTGTFCTVDSVVDMLKRQIAETGHDRMEIDSEDDIQAGEWLTRGDVDLVAKTVADFREQRLSMVQSLRQFVLCYESVLDWVVEQHMLNDGLKGKDGDRRSYHG